MTLPSRWRRRAMCACLGLAIGLAAACGGGGTDHDAWQDARLAETWTDRETDVENDATDGDPACTFHLRLPREVRDHVTVPAGACVWIDEPTRLTRGGVLHLQAGTRVFLRGPGTLTVAQGARVRWIGTERDPVEVRRAPGSQEGCAGVVLLSDDERNRLDWVHFLGCADRLADGAARRAQLTVATGARVRLLDAAFVESGGHGLAMEPGVASLTLRRVEARGSALPWLWIDPEQLGEVVSASVQRGPVAVQHGALRSAGNRWTAPGGPYLMEGSLRVLGRLRIDAGATLVWSPDQGLSVEGRGDLACEGSVDEEVVLRAASDSLGWRGLRIRGVGAHADLQGLRVLGAGATGWMSAPEGTALWVERGGHVTAADTALDAGDAPALWVDEDSSVSLRGPLRLRSTHPYVLALPAGALEEAQRWVEAETTSEGQRALVWGSVLDTPVTWGSWSWTPEIEGHLRIRSVLTLAPGVTLRFSQRADVMVEATGHLEVSGREDAPISLLGAFPLRGTWRGVAVEGTMAARHLSISDAGAPRAGALVGAAIDLFPSASMSLHDSALRNNAGWALRLRGDASVEPLDPVSEGGNTFEDNELGALSREP